MNMTVRVILSNLVMSLYHTARRSAITNMHLSGKFSTRQIMSVSGHKKEETFNKYIRLSLDEKADDVARAAYDGLF